VKITNFANYNLSQAQTFQGRRVTAKRIMKRHPVVEMLNPMRLVFDHVSIVTQMYGAAAHRRSIPGHG
jgi:hypothetical protein